MASRSPSRPVSPHLGIWRWRVNMTVSILHRATGSGMATVGTLLLVWWLAAIAGGPESYTAFQRWFATDAGHLNAIGYVIGIGLTYALFQHMMSGIRHFVLDTGAGYELKTNRVGAWATIVAAVALTVIVWLYLGMK